MQLNVAGGEHMNATVDEGERVMKFDGRFFLCLFVNVVALASAVVFTVVVAVHILHRRRRKRSRLNRKLYIFLVNRSLVDIWLLLIGGAWRYYIQPTLSSSNSTLSTGTKELMLLYSVEAYSMSRLISFNMSIVTNFLLLCLKLTATVAPFYYRTKASLRLCRRMLVGAWVLVIGSTLLIRLMANKDRRMAARVENLRTICSYLVNVVVNLFLLIAVLYYTSSVHQRDIAAIGKSARRGTTTSSVGGRASYASAGRSGGSRRPSTPATTTTQQFARSLTEKRPSKWCDASRRSASSCSAANVLFATDDGETSTAAVGAAMRTAASHSAPATSGDGGIRGFRLAHSGILFSMLNFTIAYFPLVLAVLLMEMRSTDKRLIARLYAVMPICEPLRVAVDALIPFVMEPALRGRPQRYGQRSLVAAAGPPAPTNGLRRQHATPSIVVDPTQPTNFVGLLSQNLTRCDISASSLPASNGIDAGGRRVVVSSSDEAETTLTLSASLQSKPQFRSQRPPSLSEAAIVFADDVDDNHASTATPSPRSTSKGGAPCSSSYGSCQDASGHNWI